MDKKGKFSRSIALFCIGSFESFLGSVIMGEVDWPHFWIPHAFLHLVINLQPFISTSCRENRELVFMAEIGI